MSRVLICFDVDGTFESSQGPVKAGDVIQLALTGIFIAIVSPSPNYPKLKDGKTSLFPRIQINKSRWENLQETAKYFEREYNTNLALKLYVSDNGDYQEAQKAGFVYIDRLMFAQVAR